MQKNHLCLKQNLSKTFGYIPNLLVMKKKSKYLAVPNSTIEGSSIDIIVCSDSEFAIAMFESVVKLTIISVTVVVDGCTIALLQSGFPGSNIDAGATLKSSNT